MLAYQRVIELKPEPSMLFTSSTLDANVTQEIRNRAQYQ